MGHPWLVAKALAGGKHYYLSHGTAMEVHQMVTQPQLVVYVTTVKPLRSRSIMGTEFRAKEGGRRIPEGVLERDYCLSWFLVGLSRSQLRKRLRALWSRRLAGQMVVLPEFSGVFRSVRRAFRRAGLSKA